MNKTRLEIMVGFFVLLAIAILFIIIFFISGVYFLQEGYIIKTHYDYIAALEKGAPVRMAGVRVGEVNKVTIEYDNVSQQPKAIAHMWISIDTKIREDAKFYIFGTMALNETYIEVVSSGDDSQRLLKDGDIMRGVDPIPMELLLEKGLNISKGLEDIAEKLNKVLGDEEMQEAMQALIIDTSELMRYMNEMVKAKGDDIGGMIEDVEVTLDKIATILETVEQGEGTMGKLLMSDELHQEMKALITEIKLHPWRLLKKDNAGKKKRFGIF